jgi:hypothetical protein
MELSEFASCCQALEEGDEITLENSLSGETGRLLFCRLDLCEVVVNGHRESWPAETCQEIGETSESPHENI